VPGSASPDAYTYRIDSYILYKTQASGRQLKQITVVVRDGQTPTKTLARTHVDVRPDGQHLTAA